MSIPILYSILAAAWYGISLTPFLRWVLFATLPTAAAAATIGLLAARRPRLPATSTWIDWLTPANSAIFLAAIGMPLIHIGLTNTDPGMQLVRILITYLGAIILGTATAFTITAKPAHRAITAPLLAIVLAAIATLGATGTLGSAYVLAASAWWLSHASQLLLNRHVTHPE
jgi:hypothetical protein